VVAFFQDVAAHGSAHVADADEADFHGAPLSLMIRWMGSTRPEIAGKAKPEKEKSTGGLVPSVLSSAACAGRWSDQLARANPL
jgi:hypothetical protein